MDIKRKCILNLSSIRSKVYIYNFKLKHFFHSLKVKFSTRRNKNVQLKHLKRSTYFF